jgi:hypothetical protein
MGQFLLSPSLSFAKATDSFSKPKRELLHMQMLEVSLQLRPPSIDEPSIDCISTKHCRQEEEEPVKNILEPKDNRAFQIDCSANPVGSLRAAADSLSVTIGQRVRRVDGEERWDSVIIQCREEGDEPTVRVLVCHPGWDAPLQVACIRSQPRIAALSHDGEILQVSLEHLGG